LKEVLNEIYKTKDKRQKNKVEIWFIEEIFDDYALIRQEIKAPEIDELDKVRFEKILEGSVEVGKKVKYII
jgi:hypothetical protein